MKRLYRVAPLALAAMLLSGCPDTKIPSPAPKVPEPKAEKTTQQGHPAVGAVSRISERFTATRLS